jgi:FkbM family methyltransferase
MIKKIIKTILDSAGYELVRKKPFGDHALNDLYSLIGSRDHLTLFDIGANKGQTSLQFHSTFSNCIIHAFEPDASTFAQLREETKQFGNIKVYNLGFGNTTERVTMNLNKNSGGNSVLPLSGNIKDFAVGEWTEKIGSTEIELTTLDHFCSEQIVKGIDILKLDVQGYELKILEGAMKVATPSFTKVIFVEVLFVELYQHQAYFKDIYAELITRGYRLAGFYNKFYKTQSPHYLLWCDAIFTSEDMNIPKF